LYVSSEVPKQSSVTTAGNREANRAAEIQGRLYKLEKDPVKDQNE